MARSASEKGCLPVRLSGRTGLLISAFIMLIFVGRSVLAATPVTTLATQQAEDDPNAQNIVIVNAELAGGSREVSVPLEAGGIRLEFILDAGEGIRLTLFNPLGRLHPLDEPNIVARSAAGRRSILIFDPHPGEWRVRLEGTGRFTFRAIVQGELFICCGQIFTRNQVVAFERGRLVAGSRGQVQLFASGYAIESLDIRTVDAAGNTIAPVRFRQNDPSILSSYVLLFDVPDRPFRLLVDGRDLSGRPFQRLLPALITPVTSPTGADQSDQLDFNPQAIDELQRTTSTGRRQVVRSRIIDWSDEPLLTAKGNQIGMRIRYRIKFPVTDSYSAIPNLYPDRLGQAHTGALNLRVRQVSVTPLPAEMEQTGWLSNARGRYLADVEYQFVVDMIPYYAWWQGPENGYCIQSKPYIQPGNRERFDRDVGSQQRLRFRFSVNGSDLEGRIGPLTEKTYVPATWLRSLKLEGAGECSF
jgi:hypothetical protein